MIKKIRLLLDYGCYPVWLYDENGDVFDTLLPEELRSNELLDAKFDSLQARYEQLFINTEKEFLYKGFNSKDEKNQFLHDWDVAVQELKMLIGNKYEVEDDIGLTFPR